MMRRTLSSCGEKRSRKLIGLTSGKRLARPRRAASG